MDPEAIRDNLRRVSEAIARAAGRSGRSAADVALLAVTKTVDVPAIRTLVDLGQTLLGENRVQPLVARAAELADLPRIRWHMIGHLQRNKVRHVLPVVECIHSVDSLRLTEEIEKHSARRERPAEVMIEVNVSGEGAKYGVAPEAAGELAAQIHATGHVRCVGLMSMAPLIEAERTRPLFAALRELRDAIRDGAVPTCTHLSMGMTNDYVVAVEEGATLVRIGTAIFAGA